MYIKLQFTKVSTKEYFHAQPKIFQGRGGFMELGHFDKHFVKNKRKKEPVVKNFGFKTKF